MSKKEVMQRVIFIAHPISGDVDGNVKKVIQICKAIHSERFLPFFPSFTWRQYLENIPENKDLVDTVNETFFAKGTVDEVWCYGQSMSPGMEKEVLLAMKYGIPIIGKTRETRKALAELSKQFTLPL